MAIQQFQEFLNQYLAASFNRLRSGAELFKLYIAVKNWL